MVKRVVYGEVKSDGVAGLTDINAREFLVLGSLALAVLILGLWPEPLVKVMDASIAQPDQARRRVQAAPLAWRPIYTEHPYGLRNDQSDPDPPRAGHPGDGLYHPGGGPLPKG